MCFVGRETECAGRYGTITINMGKNLLLTQRTRMKFVISHATPFFFFFFFVVTKPTESSFACRPQRAKRFSRVVEEEDDEIMLVELIILRDEL